MKKLFITMFAAGTIGLLASCGTAQNAASSAYALKGDWRITNVEGLDVKQKPGDREAYIGFNVKDGQMSGCAGCNRIFGPYTLGEKSGTISFANTASTRMMCADMTVEDRVLGAMAKVAKYKIKNGNTLQLKNSDGKVVMTLEKK